MTIKAQTGPGANPPRPFPSRELAALAGACLLLDDAWLYGLIENGPEINRGRCERLLAKLRSEGIVPTPEEIEASALALMAKWGVVRDG